MALCTCPMGSSTALLSRICLLRRAEAYGHQESASMSGMLPRDAVEWPSSLARSRRKGMKWMGMASFPSRAALDRMHLTTNHASVRALQAHHPPTLPPGHVFIHQITADKADELKVNSYKSLMIHYIYIVTCSHSHLIVRSTNNP